MSFISKEDITDFRQIDDLPSPLNYLVSKANNLLKSRSEDEIFYAYHLMYWFYKLLEADHKDLQENPDYEDFFLRHEELLPTFEHWNEAEIPDHIMLFRLRHYFDIADIPEFPDAKWSELFAAHSLWHAEIAFTHLFDITEDHLLADQVDQKIDTNEVKELLEELQHQLIQCAELLTIAEALEHPAFLHKSIREDATQVAKEYVSSTARRKADTRHAPGRKIKESVAKSV